MVLNYSSLENQDQSMIATAASLQNLDNPPPPPPRKDNDEFSILKFIRDFQEIKILCITSINEPRNLNRLYIH